MSAGDLSKEQLRDARLRAMGIIPQLASSSSSSSSSMMAVPPATAGGEVVSGDNIASHFHATRTMIELCQVKKRMFMGGGATEEDLTRWYSQGFRFCTTPSFGLKQATGGPCGILAATQAEILKYLLFGELSTTETVAKACSDVESTVPSPSTPYVAFPAPFQLPIINHEQQMKVLSIALTKILARAATASGCTSVQIQVVTMVSVVDVNKPFPTWMDTDLTIHSFQTETECEMFIADNIAQFQSDFGCLLFLISLMISRKIEALTADMDDVNNTLIGQFGHCNQDLINLLLTGRATSNVMDGEMPLGDSGLVIKGIFSKSSTGYLTHLEALRYCEVGSFYKIPEYPVWVIGSSSHFTVLFSFDKMVNKESSAEHLQSTLQRIFKSVDSDECGFIPSYKLKQVLSLLHLEDEYATNPILQLIEDETSVARLRGALQVDGEIILWSAFWQNVSSLMCGTSIDVLISIPIIIPPDVEGIQHEGDTGDNAHSGGKRLRSDSDLAREMQAEFDGVGDNSGGSSNGLGNNQGSSTNNRVTNNPQQQSINTPVVLLNFDALFAAAARPVVATAAAPVPTPVHDTAPGFGEQGRGMVRSDSDLARELQAQWDLDDNSSNMPILLPVTAALSTVASSPPLVPTAATTSAAAAPSGGGGAEKAGTSNSSAKNTSASNNEAFTMYHFNGMESAARFATLTMFQLRLKSSEDAVGQNIAFGGSEIATGNGHFICPIEEVLRTRWPACKIDWMGGVPPSID